MFNKIRNIFIAREFARNITLDEIPRILRNRFEKDIRAFEGRARPAINSLQNELSVLRNLLQELGRKEVSSTYTNSLKNRFCERALSILETEDPDNSYQSVASFSASMRSAVSEMSNLRLKEIVHLHAFRDDMNKIASQVKIVFEKVETLDKIISDFAVLKQINEVENEAGIIINDIKNKQEIENETKSIENDISYFQNKLENETKNFENFLDNENFQKIRMLELEVAELEKEKALIEQQLDSEFSSVERPMKKFQYHVQLEKKGYAMLDDYVKNPKNTFLSDDAVAIKKIIEDIKNAIEKDEIDIEEKKYEKVVELLRNIDFLKSLREQHKGTSIKVDEIRRGIESFRFLFDKKQEYEREINSTKIKIDNLKKDTEKKAKEYHKIENKISENRNKIEAMLSDLLKERIYIRYEKSTEM